MAQSIAVCQDRNAAIFQAYEGGATAKTLAATWKLSRRRVWDIIRQYAYQSGKSIRSEKKRPSRPPGFGEPCRHCKTGKVCRSRRLCSTCYFTPGVKELYPVKNCKANYRGSTEDFNGAAKPPDAPTNAIPGSPEKIEVLRERAAQGMGLFHAGDFSGDVESEGILRRKTG